MQGKGRAGAWCAAAAGALWLSAAAAAAADDAPEHAAARLLAQLDAVRSVACEVRREAETDAGRIELLSRVFYERPDRLHVQNYAPVRRVIVCDGTNFVSHVEGQPRAFARRVEDLSREMLDGLRRVPGSAADLLQPLCARPQTALPPSEAGGARYGYAAERSFTVLELDAKGRLVSVGFYDGPGRAAQLGAVTYADFREVVPGVWIPMRHDAWTRTAGVERRERTRLSRYEANSPVSPGLFEPGNFVRGVAFVDAFDKLAP